MSRDIIKLLVALGAAGLLASCSEQTPDQKSENQSAAPASGAQPAKPVGTSSELDKMLNAPINPAEDGIVPLDNKVLGNSGDAKQEPSKAP